MDKRRRTRGEDGPATEEGRDAEGGGGDWRVSASQAKLDELFLHWLALPEAQTYVKSLLTNVRKEKPMLSISTGGWGGSSAPSGAYDGHSPVSSPTGARNPHIAFLQSSHRPAPRSPTGRSSAPRHGELLLAVEQQTSQETGQGGVPANREQAVASACTDVDGHTAPATAVGAEAECHHKSASGPSHESIPASRPNRATDAIPRFYFPNKCSDPLMLQCQNEAREIDAFFTTNDKVVSRADFQPITRILGFPSFFNDSLFDKVGPVDGLVTGFEVKKWWDDHCKHKDCETRLFELLRSEGAKYVTRQDWKLHLALFLNTHPGLEFLKATPEFQERYLECVVERIYYTVNKSDNGKLSLSEILKSNLVAVLRNLDEEPDINQILDYFSYEHFYVCYCNFWELDTDHDFLLDKEDLIKLGNYSLTYRIVDRIFAGAPRPVSSGVPGKIGYLDFIWVLLSEEDKNSDTAIRYWFKAIDIEADGWITRHDMEFFYKEQLHRMDCLAQEVVQFEDMMCQMTDMVKPEREGFFSVVDLKRCKQSNSFFNVLFNLTKFIQGDQKDPAQIFHERSTPELTDWDRYAKMEYSRLAMEDEGEPEGELGSLNMETGLGMK